MTVSRAPRLGSLDLLRGLTVAAMIVVNNPGNWNAVFSQLSHAPWNGLTIADCIFPAFIFIMGVALGLTSEHDGPARARDRIRPILRRGALLVVMGLALNLAAAWPSPAHIRVPGVLQRIGLTYIVTALLLRRTGPKGQAACAVGLLALHSLLLAAAPIEPGSNLGAVVDHALFGEHLLTASGDPEGLLGLLTSVVTALLGVAVARRLKQHLLERGALDASAILHVAMIGAAGVLSGVACAWVIPINKALWTASFTLVTGGMAALGLALCLLASRTRIVQTAEPLLWLGTNPLAIYFLSELSTIALQRPWLMVGGDPTALKDLAYWDLLVPLVGDSGGPWSSLAWALLYTTLWVGVAGLLRWKRIRLRV